jgi:hypothetical protein
VKTKDFIFLLFFFIFSKKGGSNFLKTGYLFFHPTNQNVGRQKNLLPYTKSQKNKSGAAEV